MKKGIHPEYREVLFHDISVDEYFLISSTLKTDKTKEWKMERHIHIILWMYLLHRILFTQVNKKFLTLVEESRNLKKDLVRNHEQSLSSNW